MPRLTAFGAEFGVTVVEVPELDADEEDDEVAVDPELAEELVTSGCCGSRVQGTRNPGAADGCHVPEI